MVGSIEYQDLIGKPFKDGGRGPIFFDCWGLVKEAFKRAGYNVPEYLISAYQPELIQAQIFSDQVTWKKLDKPEKNCLVLMRIGKDALVNHCGFYLDNDKILHTREKTGVIVQDSTTPTMKAIIIGYLLPPKDFLIND